MKKQPFLLLACALLAITPAQLAAADADKKESKDDKIKPYDEVITEKFRTTRGLFFVHRDGDKVYFEIPAKEFETPMLWVTQIAQTQAGHSHGGEPVGDRVVRWQLRDEDVLLRDVRYTIRADISDPIKHSVATTSLDPILGRFPVKAWGKDKSPVIDVSDLYLGDQPEFSAKKTLSAAGADRARSFVDTIKAFPENIESKVYITYKLSNDQGVVTVQLHHSMVRLPAEPMRPRLQDDRVGFFSVSFEDYGSPKQQVREVRYATRWRLEKKDPAADVSEPKKPIVFYVGRGVPEKWRPWVMKGIEAWQPAFEAAGFKNAIMAKEAPSLVDDPDWDGEDARYSVIQWLPATIENAYGPHVHDPRSGEIIEADIRLYHNVLKLLRDWYYVQASPSDPRAQKLPLPDELMGELVAYVTAHEVGHSIGMQHNMKASSSYSVEQLRDPEFTKKYGTEASIMDYGRFNYVAQPGDGAHLIPMIGPYDLFAIEWAYKQFKDTKNLEEDKPLLEEIVARQVADPKLRFGSANPRQDPSAQTEDLGSNSVEATRLGLLNVMRVATNLVQATSEKGESYDLLRNMYNQLLGQWQRELTHVANVVGGVVENNLWFGYAEGRYDSVPQDQQKAAVTFLAEHAFTAPAPLIDPNIVGRLEPSGTAARLASTQRAVLSTLLSDARLQRMSELAQRSADAYTPAQLLQDVTAAVWSELDQDPVAINLYRRNLQRAHFDILQGYAKSEQSSEVTAAARLLLAELIEKISKQLPKAQDTATRAHLHDLHARLDQLLNPK